MAVPPLLATDLIHTGIQCRSTSATMNTNYGVFAEGFLWSLQISERCRSAVAIFAQPSRDGFCCWRGRPALVQTPNLCMSATVLSTTAAE